MPAGQPTNCVNELLGVRSEVVLDPKRITH
jgi:hypothetical protein